MTSPLPAGFSALEHSPGRAWSHGLLRNKALVRRLGNRAGRCIPGLA